MMVSYFDESYNQRAICVGGWIASDTKWHAISRQWNERLAYENRISVKRGLQPIIRYHAADCSSLQGEFKGWDVKRQVLFVKRLVNVVVSHKPMAFAWGCNLAELTKEFPDADRGYLRRQCYRMCVRQCLEEIGLAMNEFYTNEKITFFHERGDLFTAAQDAFFDVTSDDGASRFKHCREYFVTFAPMGWENCTPLQPADMIAYDVFRLCDRRLQGSGGYVRRSLEEITGSKVPIVAGYTKMDSLLKMYRESQSTSNPSVRRSGMAMLRKCSWGNGPREPHFRVAAQPGNETVVR
jgi:hypothetical protein